MPTPSPHAPRNDKSTHLHWKCAARPREWLPPLRAHVGVCAEPSIASRTLAALTPLRGGLRPSWTRPPSRQKRDQGPAGAVPGANKSNQTGSER